jgi:putative hydrolase of the HAD superfamily
MKNYFHYSLVLFIYLKVGKTVKSKEADYALENVNNLAKVVPEIWVSGMDGGDQRISRSKSEIDSILAITAVGA